MASTIETTLNSVPSVETEAAPEPARTSRGRRVAIWAMAAAAVAGVGALTVAVVGYADDSSPNRPAPAVVEPEHSELQDPLMTRFGATATTRPWKPVDAALPLGRPVDHAPLLGRPGAGAPRARATSSDGAGSFTPQTRSVKSTAASVRLRCPRGRTAGTAVVRPRGTRPPCRLIARARRPPRTRGRSTGPRSACSNPGLAHQTTRDSLRTTHQSLTSKVEWIVGIRLRRGCRLLKDSPKERTKTRRDDGGSPIAKCLIGGGFEDQVRRPGDVVAASGGREVEK